MIDAINIKWYIALVMTLPKCQICRKQLTDPASIARGIGPDCLAKRETFLAAAGSSEREIADLALFSDPTVTRWLSMAARAIGAGRQDHVDRFLKAARCARNIVAREGRVA